ncbi:hypothetical protein AALP_AA8G401700 [Arabis alpina]|uniref:Uncharacterized protein n=1 Tax=Arabis alpina TaxID=50452 RepID=A0A087GCH3_ARAAL|nr:hypothetical protein AALP_AA8G401700 [Arabis alpina]
MVGERKRSVATEDECGGCLERGSEARIEGSGGEVLGDEDGGGDLGEGSGGGGGAIEERVKGEARREGGGGGVLADASGGGSLGEGSESGVLGEGGGDRAMIR